ncbi:hypothetical protein BC833DRAFT_569103, partial [Globomyces pollinis-pini]
MSKSLEDIPIPIGESNCSNVSDFLDEKILKSKILVVCLEQYQRDMRDTRVVKLSFSTVRYCVQSASNGDSIHNYLQNLARLVPSIMLFEYFDLLKEVKFGFLMSHISPKRFPCSMNHREIENEKQKDRSSHQYRQMNRDELLETTDKQKPPRSS